MKNLPTPSELRELLDYDPDTGKFSWRPRDASRFNSERARNSWNRKHAGKEAFHTPNPQGYLYGRISRIGLAAHRVAFAIANGRWPGVGIDHINGDPSDNRLSNLREASYVTNGKNCRRRTDNKSGVTGVFKSGKIYRAEICSNGNRISLGAFHKIDEAIAARKAAEKELGFHENHGR